MGEIRKQNLSIQEVDNGYVVHQYGPNGESSTYIANNPDELMALVDELMFDTDEEPSTN